MKLLHLAVSIPPLIALTACLSVAEVPIEAPARASLDMSPFSRILVAGFISGGSEDVDLNLETVRLLRSQLRMTRSLTVVSNDVFLLDAATRDDDLSSNAMPASRHVRSERDLRAYDYIFSDTGFWQRIGEEYPGTLILTGTLLLTIDRVPIRLRVDPDFAGRDFSKTADDAVRNVRVLSGRFVFIDGRTGSVAYAASFREATGHDVSQQVPALSCYFELMERILPELLGTVRDHTVHGRRALLK